MQSQTDANAAKIEIHQQTLEKLVDAVQQVDTHNDELYRLFNKQTNILAVSGQKHAEFKQELLDKINAVDLKLSKNIERTKGADKSDVYMLF